MCKTHKTIWYEECIHMIFSLKTRHAYQSDITARGLVHPHPTFFISVSFNES